MKPATTWKRMTQFRNMYIYLLPAVALSLVFNYGPMVGILMAFQDFDIVKGFFGSPFVGIKHFAEFLANKEFYPALWNTLGINILVLAIGFPLPIVFALLLNELTNGWFKRVAQTITYLPHFISWVVLAGMIYRLLDYDSGSVTAFASKLAGFHIPFLREEKYFWPILIFASIWKELGWNSIIYLAALSGIDVEQYEAATVDGAGRFKKIWYITLPGIFPVAGLLLILTMGTLFSTAGGAGLDAIFNLQNPNVMAAANTLDLYIFNEGVKWSHYSYAAAIGTAQSAVALAMVVGANYLSRKLSGYGAF
jgi:putative aldouronate transport system permease protein